MKFIHEWQARTLSVLSKSKLNMNFRFNVGEYVLLHSLILFRASTEASGQFVFTVSSV